MVTEEQELARLGLPVYHAKYLFKQCRQLKKPVPRALPDDAKDFSLKEFLGLEMAQHFQALDHIGCQTPVVLQYLGDDDLKDHMPAYHRRVLIARILKNGHD